MFGSEYIETQRNVMPSKWNLTKGAFRTAYPKTDIIAPQYDSYSYHTLPYIRIELPNLCNS